MMLAFLSIFGDAPANCVNSFFGLVPWYQYLNLRPDCSINLNLIPLSPTNLNQLWLIAIALLDDLMRLGGLAAVGFIIYGAFRYITSQGNPEAIKAAWSTIFNAIVGLVIVLIAAPTINYMGNLLGANASTVNGLPNISADQNHFTNILNLIFAIIGAVSVIMVIYGGFKYTTSRGEAQQTGQAKDTILYALIGLAIAGFASILVNFIVVKVHGG
jgi:hypothetical protein